MPKVDVEPVGSRSEIKKRLKCARIYAGYGRPRDLAAHAAMKRNGLTASRVIQIEAEQQDASEAQLRVIAEACGLPFEWFVADYATLRTEPSQLERVEQKLDRLLTAIGLEDETADLNSAVDAFARALEERAAGGATGASTG